MAKKSAHVASSPTPSAEKLIRTAIRDWRDSLINLTGSNRLLNFKPSRAGAVEVVRPSATDVLAGLAAGRKFRFRSIAAPGGAVPADSGATVATLGDAAIAPPTQLSIYDDVVPVQRAGFLDTPKSETDLHAALRNLARRTTQELLDRGVWILYLACGSLTWREQDGTTYTSPLLLVPVQLVSAGAREEPILSLTDEDPVINPALTLKMAQFGISLPGIDDLEDLRLGAVLGELRSAIGGNPGWTVAENLVLSYFSFHKEAMYRDLLDNEELIAAHPIIGALATGGRGQENNDFLFTAIADERIDEEAPAETTPLILDADSSQRACIAAAIEGRSFVMDGPPGTGKSQTIANMIGALLHVGKTVLFVSEKAAALDVVRNRLSETGLGNYVLELHSHKATRREVAVALGAALDTVPVPGKPVSPMEINVVREQRRDLNAYADAMNTPREPLGFSLHDVLGMISLLHAVPAAPATGKAPNDLTTAALGRIRVTSASLARAWRPAAQGTTYLWRGVTERTSLDARLYQANSALETLTGITTLNAPLADAFAVTRPSHADTLADLLDKAAARPPDVPNAWLTRRSLDEVFTTVALLDGDLSNLTAHEERATRAAGVSWRALPVPASMPTTPLDAFLDLNPRPVPLDALDAQSATRLADTFTADAERLATRIGSLSGLTSMLGLPPAVTYADAEDTLAVAALGAAPERPERCWMSIDGLEAARVAVEALDAARRRLTDSERQARRYYSDAALSADLDGLAERFATVHKGLRRLSAAYRTDKHAVAVLAREGVPRNTAIGNLRLAADWRTSVKSLSHAEAVYGPTLGFYYVGINTDFNLARRAIGNAETAVGRARTSDLTRLADFFATNANREPGLQELVSETRLDLEAWRTSLAPEPMAAARPGLIDLPLVDGVTWLRSHLAPLRSAAALAQAMSDVVARTVTVGEGRRLLGLRASVDDAHAGFAERGPCYAEYCEDLFAGLSTDIVAIRAALTWAQSMRIQPGMADAALTTREAKVLAAAEPSPALREAASHWRDSKAALLGAFDKTRQMELADDLDDYVDGQDLLAALREDGGGQGEWLAYLAARKALTGHGLDVAIEFCIAERVPASQVPQVLERALLQEWADHILMTDPSLRIVRAEDRIALIAEYRNLDKRLVGSASSAIITAVNGRRPQISIGEPAVIQRQAALKRKHMPVRLLIDRTRHATQTIKPCFMMSPLAVSQYLTPDMAFDVVIFDEASQVRPSDAINCIYRGSALIAAGDQKQLPPTSFWAAGNDDADADWTEEEEDTSKDFESILDLTKASGAFKSLTLRWHYRSRHEALIAFSNVSFYKGKLVTFPGAQDESPNVGVDLYHVAGVYRRGSSRDNLVEAVKVADRVMHHFETRPTLTLGVVTFSEAQAATIVRAVEEARLLRPDLDRFFTDDRLGGFFVKSLESVQGDERDVMIFSIGYGPDENNKITMNFGPVNRPGGWRRLNVAVTRARYRNEIVSSIMASDITEGARSEGVRHLRRYLDYAERGIPALGLDMTQPGGDAESPFEEAVIASIRSWGYDVTPQVGAAGYRIDMGVRHPDHPGVFVMGVECDGFMYHSSRVARDRDRLREQVLRGLGWHLHRIWGTAWYRNQTGEENRLRAAIEAATVAPVRGLLGGEADDHIERPEILTSAALLPDTPDWATPYEIASVDPLPRWIDPSQSGSRYDMRTSIEQIVATEGPIHLSLIFQRLRDAWNIGRVGPRIRENIEGAVHLADVQRIGDFVDHPGRPTETVRTPTAACVRTVEQVADAELSAAIIHFAQASGGVPQDDLTTAVARLYGWNRRGPEIGPRLDSLVHDLLAEGRLTGDADRLALQV